MADDKDKTGQDRRGGADRFLPGALDFPMSPASVSAMCHADADVAVSGMPVFRFGHGPMRPRHPEPRCCGTALCGIAGAEFKLED